MNPPSDTSSIYNDTVVRQFAIMTVVVRVFELGRVFLRDASVKNSDTTVEGFHQPMRVAGLLHGSADELNWSRKGNAADFFDIKGDVQALLAPVQATFEPFDHPALHPGRSARVWVNGQAIGCVGELHPKWRQAYELPTAPLLFELDLEAVLQRQVPVFSGVSKHQAVQRDLAVLVPEKTTHAALIAAIHAANTNGLLRHAELFDVYRPKDQAPAQAEKSLAVRLTLHNDEASLTDPQIEAAMAAVLAQVVQDLGARQR